MVPQLRLNTSIGSELRSKPRLRALALGVGLLIVGIDFFLAAHRYALWTRAVIASASILVLWGISSFDRNSLGLRLSPIQPASYWIRATIIIAAVMLIPILLFLAMATWLNWRFPIPRIPPDQAAATFLHMCVIAPVVEESIYRFTICIPTTTSLGPHVAILLSGAIFAGLHFVYGNPGPDNFVAGYVLAWAFLKSGSLMIPIVLHSLGNCVAFACQFVAWFVI